MSAPSPRSTLPLPTGRGWWLVAAGIAIGVLVFLALLMGKRDEAPWRPDEQPPAAAAPVFRPLPSPTGSAIAESDGAADPAASGARIEEPRPPAPLAGAAGDIPPPPTRIVPTGPAASPPVPVESPGPRYPARALRRGESGEVLLRVEVDARGMPARIDVASSSGSRDLDRAAQTAVRRWRFRPAMRDGQPEAAVVNVPVVFEGRP